MGKKKFNMDSKKGIEYLVSHGLLTNTAEDVAQFLYKGKGLSKTVIGDYLGEKMTTMRLCPEPLLLFTTSLTSFSFKL